MSTELSNGVIIPEEYSDDWYDEMSINLRKLNDVITAASDNATDIQRLDTDKANQSDLTALSGRVSQNETDIIALQTAVSGALKREIVQTLPTEDISTTTIYMIRNSQSSGTNIYDEYMYINSQWELIGTSATDFSNYYTKNETDNLLSGKVDNSTLGSYYTKTESDNLLSAKANQTDLTALGGRVTQTETDITALQTAVSGALKREIVQTLPTQDISTTTIYMIRNTTTSGDNIYDEYMYINNLWELIGTSATDFSNYYTKTEIDTLLSGKADDNSVVHLSGTEIISGPKTFSNTATLASVNVEDIRWKSLVNQTVDLNDCYVSRSGAISGYYTTDISSGANISNKAVNTAFTMLSLTTRRVSASDYQVRQVFYGSGAKYIRTCSNGTWTAWVNETDKFVTTDTAQTIAGLKNFTDYITSDGDYLGNEASTNQRTNFLLRSNRDTAGKSGIYITKFRQNRSQGELLPLDLQKIGFDVLENKVRTNNVFDIQVTGWSGNVPTQVKIVSSITDYSFGSSYFPCKINELEPSALSMPDLANGVDICSYLTAGNSNNTYTPSVNGWISISIGIASGGVAIFLEQGDMKVSSYSNTAKYQDTYTSCFACLPVVAGVVVNIGLKGSSNYIKSAKFFPCQGNI